MAYKHTFQRHKTHEVRVGDKVVGGDNPIWVQSMTTPDTYDVEATVTQIHRLEEAGWVRAKWTTTENKRRARVYEITPAGRKQLQEEERRWTSVAAAVGQVLREA